MAELIYNDDGGNLFAYHPGDDMSVELVDQRVETAAESGVTIFVLSVCSMRTNYDSDVWESWLDGYDPDGPDDQALFAGMDPHEIRAIRAEREAMRKLKNMGIDYVGRVLSQCRKKGMSPWISMRMNDHHGTVPVQNSIVSTFWRQHPEFRRHPDRLQARGFQTLDYARPEVRDHYRKLIIEALQRYDVEGFELDAMRSPFFFKIGREMENLEIMNAWIREVRQMLEASARQRGHPIQMAVRVPSEPTSALRFGLDVATWAREGLVDLMITCGGAYGGEIDGDTPIRLWRDLLAPHGVKVAGSFTPSEFRYPGNVGDGVKGLATAAPDTTIGTAMAMLYAGADGIELFNYFPEKVLQNGRGWTMDSFKSTLKAMRSVETMLPLRRKHVVTCRQLTAPGELITHNPLVDATRNWCYEFGTGEFPLPAQGERLAFRLQTGPRPTGRKVQVVIGMEAGLPDAYKGSGNGPAVLVNDVGGGIRPVHSGDVRFTYDVPEEALSDGEHVIEVISETNVTVRITRVEFIVEAIK